MESLAQCELDGLRTYCKCRLFDVLSSCCARLYGRKDGFFLWSFDMSWDEDWEESGFSSDV